MKQDQKNQFSNNNISIEIEKRIQVMESKDYIFPKRFKKIDYACCFSAILLNLIIVISTIIYCSMH